MNPSLNPPAPLPATSTRSPAHFHLLTALRGAAAASIVFFHISIPFRQSPEGLHPVLAWLFFPFQQGWFGVDVFFVISGYGLAAKLAASPQLHGLRGAGSFARNRAWRIYPVYWACCLLALGLAYAGSQFNHLDWRELYPATTVGWLASLLLLEPFTGTSPLLPIVTWTLTCELGFYTLMILGILTRPRLSQRVLLGSASALAFASLANLVPVLRWFFDFWPEFTCGLLAFAAVHARRHGGSVAPSALTLTALALTAWGFDHERVAVAGGFSLGLIILWPYDKWLSGLRPLRWLAWIGGLSYPLFLLHVPVTSRVVNLCGRVIRPDSLAFTGVIATACLVALTAAWAVQRWIEQPLQAFEKSRPAA